MSTLRQLGSAASSTAGPSSTAGVTPAIQASDSGSDLSGGAIAGIAIGAFVGLVLIALLAYLLSRWRPSVRSEPDAANAPALAAEPPITQAPAAEPPAMEPTTYAAQDTADVVPPMPTYYPADTLTPYMEPEPGTAPPPSHWPAPLGAAAAHEDTAAMESPVDPSIYEQETMRSARRQDLGSRPSSRGSMDKYDEYAESWPSRRPRRHQRRDVVDAALQDGEPYVPMSDWDDSASELPYMRTPRRRGRGEW